MLDNQSFSVKVPLTFPIQKYFSGHEVEMIQMENWSEASLFTEPP